MRALLTLLVLAAAADVRAQTVAWPLPSYGARLDGNVLVSLDPDLRGVRAIDIVAERTLWQTHVQDAPAGGHDLARLRSGHVLVIAGPSLIVLDSTSGSIVARHALSSVFHARSFFWEVNGVCGMNSECAFQPLDCDDARPLGEPIVGQRQSRMSYDRREMHEGCWGFDVDPVGRRGDAVVVDVRGIARDVRSRGPGRGEDVRLTIDARTGAIRSRRPMPETRRSHSPPPAAEPVSALEVVRENDGGVPRAYVRRRADGVVLARFDSDAWWLGAHTGRTVVYVHLGPNVPGEVRLYRDDPR